MHFFSLSSALALRPKGLVEGKPEHRDRRCDVMMVRKLWRISGSWPSMLRSTEQAAWPRPFKMPALKSFPNPARAQAYHPASGSGLHWWLRLSCIPSSDDYRSARGHKPGPLPDTDTLPRCKSLRFAGILFPSFWNHWNPTGREWVAILMKSIAQFLD